MVLIWPRIEPFVWNVELGIPKKIIQLGSNNAPVIGKAGANTASSIPQ